MGPGVKGLPLGRPWARPGTRRQLSIQRGPSGTRGAALRGAVLSPIPGPPGLPGPEQLLLEEVAEGTCTLQRGAGLDRDSPPGQGQLPGLPGMWPRAASFMAPVKNRRMVPYCISHLHCNEDK